MRTKRISSALTLPAALVCVLALTGCAATQTALSKRELDVQTKMSSTIFLDPVAPARRSIFVQMRNTSSVPEFDVAREVTDALSGKGFRVVDDPNVATYFLQGNVLYVGKATRDSAQAAGGYGGPLGGAMTGVMVAGATAGAGGMSNRAGMLGLVLGGVTETVAGALIKDSTYSVVTDVQIKERLAPGRTVQQRSSHALRQGESGSEQVSTTGESDMRAYQTRIVSTANKVNLALPEAMPSLKTGLVRALTGLF